MDKGVLRRIGLTENEAEVYLALLRHGPCLASRVVDTTGLNRAHTYDRLERLIEKGLANYVVRENRKYFDATPPKRLLGYLDEKSEEIAESRRLVGELLPELESMKASESKISAEIFKGKEGMKTMMELLLAEGQTIYSIGYTANVQTALPLYYEQWTKKRVAKKTWRKLIVTHEKLGLPGTQKPLTEVRVLPKEYSIPSSTILCGDKSMIFIPHGDEFIGIVIQSSEVMKTNMTFFDFLWRKAKKPVQK